MKKILLIEKDEDVRANLSKVLELVNYKVFAVGDGQNAAALALSETPDMIICGSFLPLLEGYDLLQKIQNNPATKDTVIHFFTPSIEHHSYEANLHQKFLMPMNNQHTQNGYNPSNGFSTVYQYGQYLSDQVNNSQRTSEPALPIIATQNEENDVHQELQITNKSSTFLSKGVNEIIADLLIDRDINYYKKKQIIFSEGNCSRNLYFIKKGKIKTYQTNDYGKQLVVDLYSENDFIGYVQLLENTNYTESAEALEETELLVIPRSDFNDLIKNNPEVMKFFVSLLTKSVTEKKNQMIGLAYNSLRKKVADSLLMICKKYKMDDENLNVIEISRDNLAAIAGTATESLIRTLTDFKSEKLIDIENNNIKILNKSKLERLSN